VDHEAPEQGSGATEKPSAFKNLVAKQRQKPDPLRILPEEAKFVEEIAQLLSDRPRALKRFVNTYRLLKASLPDIEREGFVTADDSSPHKVCLMQLAFLTSHPRLAAQLVTKLEAVSVSTGPDPDTFGFWLSKNYQPNDATRAALDAIPVSHEMRLMEFLRWLPLTSRYMFHRAD
jgi:hypothetical protein